MQPSSSQGVLSNGGQQSPPKEKESTGGITEDVEPLQSMSDEDDLEQESHSNGGQRSPPKKYYCSPICEDIRMRISRLKLEKYYNASKETPNARCKVKNHAKDTNLSLLKDAYGSMKHNMINIPPGHSNNDEIFLQKSPIGNTVLHIAAMHGNDVRVDKIAEKAPHLLTEPNDNGDTALHLAAKAGYISTIRKLLKVLPLTPYPENPILALYEILVKNKQGNTLFHEAILNGHHGVLRILDEQVRFKTSFEQYFNQAGDIYCSDDEKASYDDEKARYEAGFRELVERAALFWTNDQGKSVLHLAIEKGDNHKDIVDYALTKLTPPYEHPGLETLILRHREIVEIMIPEYHAITLLSVNPTLYNEVGMGTAAHGLTSDNATEKESPENEKHQETLIPYGPDYVPRGKPLLIWALLKKDEDTVQIILERKKEWIHLRDQEGRTALHYAASIGFLQGVELLLKSCISCNMERDNDGYLPVHLASAAGHDKVVKKLLEYCPNPREMVDKYGRNIVHIAAESGMFKVVRCILQDSDHRLVKMMINDQDAKGNTPLHLATLHCHPKIVHALTWDKSVDLNLVNKKNQTALDIYPPNYLENPTLTQQLTWIALKSADVQYADKWSECIKVPSPPLEFADVEKNEKQPDSTKVTLPSPSEVSVEKEQAPNMDPYQARIGTLMLVSTLITTVTFAAGFTLPGGTNDSDPGHGMAVMLNQTLFKLFIFCNTISMYGSMSVTIILIWTQLGDLTLALVALKVAMPLLGITLATLSLTFFFGVHLVISDLSWLATTFLVMCVIFIFMLLLLYALLQFPSSSSIRVSKYISYYPFLLLAWLAETYKSDE